MSPIDRISVNDKLFRLQESIRIIEELLSEKKEEVINDERLKSALYFNLIISIETILDIGNHLLAESFNKPAGSYKDIILGLGEKGIISKEFSLSNQDMGDFRNKIIHDYDSIDDTKAYQYAVKAPEIFKSFMKSFVGFTDKEDVKN